MTHRPFEVGDFVVYKDTKRNTRYFNKIHGVNNDHVCVGWGEHYFLPMNGKPKSGYKHLTKITAIRSPRKGTKESRNIVAMLARKYHAYRLLEWRIDKRGNKENFRKKHWSENVMTALDCFEDAKEMLK